MAVSLKSYDDLYQYHIDSNFLDCDQLFIFDYHYDLNKLNQKNSSEIEIFYVPDAYVSENYIYEMEDIEDIASDFCQNNEIKILSSLLKGDKKFSASKYMVDFSKHIQSGALVLDPNYFDLNSLELYEDSSLLLLGSFNDSRLEQIHKKQMKKISNCFIHRFIHQR